MKKKRSHHRPPVLFPSMLRLLPMLWACGCGGFETPPQNVAVGLALTPATALPPRLEHDGHLLQLTRLQLTGSARIEDEPFATLSDAELSLSSGWTQLAEGPLPRGDYDRVKLELTGIVLDGSWDGRPFRLESRQPETRELQLGAGWRVELGKQSALSLVADPLRWMSTRDGAQQLELIDPASSQASEQLMDRFLESLTAARDDDHDGVEDPTRP